MDYGIGELTAEARSTPREPKKDIIEQILCELCTTMLKSSRSLRKIFSRPQPSRTGIYSRQVAKFGNF